MSKVVTRLAGGLGNQLFIYAASRRLASKNEAELVIDDVTGFARDYKYKRQYQLSHFRIPCRIATRSERLEPFSRLRRVIKKNWNKRLPYGMRNYIVQQNPDFDPRLLTLRPQGTLYMEGYWQSENYFKDIEDKLRKELRIIPPSDLTNIEMARKISQCKSVALHFRYFDLDRAGGINNAGDDYYQRAIQYLELKCPGSHYFVFSDKPMMAKARIPVPDYRVTLVQHNNTEDMAYADMWLMAQCQNFIIANSTFSWWGAWLATSNSKLVVAPGFHMKEGVMSWGFNGLIPDSWTTL